MGGSFNIDPGVPLYFLVRSLHLKLHPCQAAICIWRTSGERKVPLLAAFHSAVSWEGFIREIPIVAGCFSPMVKLHLHIVYTTYILERSKHEVERFEKTSVTVRLLER